MSRYGARTRLLGAGSQARVGQWFQRSLIKSIQRGTISIANGATSNTATVTAVVLANSRLVNLGNDAGSDTTADTVCVRIALTNSTTITATVNTVSAAVARVVSYELIEYWPGVMKSVQRGTLTTAAAASGTAAITSVTTTKATLDFLGMTTTYAVTDGVLTQVQFRIELTNATTITGNGTTAITRTAGYQVIEWY